VSSLQHKSYFTFEERREALRTASLVLEVRQPCRQAYCNVRQGPNCLDAHAEWRWPGVVRVTVRNTGELIAESKPGEPTVLATPLAATLER
jgi:hypothetical protein